METPTSNIKEIDIQKSRIEHDLYKNTIASVHKNIYTPRKLMHRRYIFPFHDNLRSVSEDAATSILPGDSVYTQDVLPSDYDRLAEKHSIVRDLMDKLPDEEVYTAVDPKRTPLSEYGAQYGYNPHGRSDLYAAMKTSVPQSTGERASHSIQQRYSSTPHADFPFHTEYMDIIGEAGEDILRDRYFGTPLHETYCEDLI